MLLQRTGKNLLFFLTSMSAQSCKTLCNPMDCSPTAFSVHEISQARILAISWGSSWPRDQTCISYISCIGRQILYYGTTMEAYVFCLLNLKGLIKACFPLVVCVTMLCMIFQESFPLLVMPGRAVLVEQMSKETY